MPTVRRTSLAHLDLVEIALRIAEDNPIAADRWIEQIEARCQALAQMPELGRKRPELAPELRSLAFGNFVIFYRPSADGIEVIRVLDGRRDLPPLFE